jgi:hypothetical protein
VTLAAKFLNHFKRRRGFKSPPLRWFLFVDCAGWDESENQWAVKAMKGDTGHGVEVVYQEPDDLIPLAWYYPTSRDLRVLREEADRFEREVIKPGQTPDSSPPLKDRDRHRERCRALAERRWSEDPTIKIVDMAMSDDLNKFGCEIGGREGHQYNQRFIEDWIRDLCPDPRPGPKSKRG